MRKITSLLLLIIATSSCTNHSEEDLTEPINIGNTRFSDIKPIIDNNCVACHSNPPQFSAPMHLTTAAAVREAIENRNLIGKISRPDGAPGLMPLGDPRLPQNSIDKIIDWRDSGFLE